MKTTHASTGAVLRLTSLFVGSALADKEVYAARHGKAYKHMHSHQDGMVRLDQLDTDSQH